MTEVAWAANAAARPHTKLNRQQIIGFWSAWTGWMLDGMDSFIYAIVLAPALTELLPKSGYEATPAMIGFAGSILFAAFLVGWGCSFIWGPIADRFGRKLKAVTGVSATVSVLKPDTLPRATHKAKRVEDRRSGVWS